MSRDAGGFTRFVLKGAGLFWALTLLMLLVTRNGYEGAIHAALVFSVTALGFTALAILLWTSS